MKVRFLLDENLSNRIKLALLRLNPDIDILSVGDPDAPPLGTLDPDVLRYVELSQRLLVTGNRKSMPEHLESHWGEGGRRTGTFLGASQNSNRAISTNPVSGLGNN